MLEYFYIIRHTPTGKLYAGSRFGKKSAIHPSQLLNPQHKNPYYTSSLFVHALIEQDGLDSFEICEIKEFPEGGALEYETTFIRENDIVRNEMWLNRSYPDGKFVCLGHSEETRRKMSQSRMGHPVSEQTRKKLSESHKGRIYPNCKEDAKELISEKLKGKPKTETHRKNISEARKQMHFQQATCLVCGKTGGYSAMKPFHFENCGKIEEATCPKCGKTGNLAGMKAKHFENCGKEQIDVECPHCGKVGKQNGMTRYHFDNCKFKPEC